MFVLAALAVAGQAGLAQEGYHPFSEPMAFDPDWQFFAPVQLQDLQDLTARQRANTGYYLTYDRLNIGLTRSDTESASNKIDFTWGNRFDFGWMNSKESGWMFSAINVSGPNVYNQYEQQRLNQFITAATNPTIQPISFQNDVAEERKYIIQDSVNVGSFASFEANKVWRMEPYRYGGILEPMVGLRYAFFGDSAANDSYLTGIVPHLPVVPPLVAGSATEELTRIRRQTDNNMLLGQFGFRYTKFINRWTLSNDMKFFGGHVYQSQATSTTTNTASYAAAPAVGVVALTDNQQTAVYGGSRSENATLGFDIRVEGAYKATKYLDLRGGFAMMYFGRGIWRDSTDLAVQNTLTNVAPASSPSLSLTNQSLIMPAFTFGIALNR